MKLAPSLWRTCRALANRRRLACLRAALRSPNRPVKELAKTAGLSEAVASDYLRQLQSRGVLAAVRDGRWVRYAPRAEPSVAHAEPVLAAMRRALAPGAANDAVLLRTLSAFTHSRRLLLLRMLQHNVGMRFAALRNATAMPSPALVRHLRKLAASNVVQATAEGWRIASRPGVLAETLLRENECLPR